jgi:hypothetical protein
MIYHGYVMAFKYCSIQIICSQTGTCALVFILLQVRMGPVLFHLYRVPPRITLNVKKKALGRFLWLIHGPVWARTRNETELMCKSSPQIRT